MFRGTLTPEQVLAAAGSQPDAQFYGHLYLGLYFEALGMKERALQHITMAAADRFERYGGYMHMVARVHLRALTSGSSHWSQPRRLQSRERHARRS